MSPAIVNIELPHDTIRQITVPTRCKHCGTITQQPGPLPRANMQHYVCGFLFSLDRSRVLLIRKNRPAWQAGKLNGVGGKVEPGESIHQAMTREFCEEAALTVAEDQWQLAMTLTGEDWTGHFFRTFGPVEEAVALTDEQLEIHSTRTLPIDMIPNLRWMIPMLLDDEVVSRQYSVDLA